MLRGLSAASPLLLRAARPLATSSSSALRWPGTQRAVLLRSSVCAAAALGRRECSSAAASTAAPEPTAGAAAVAGAPPEEPAAADASEEPPAAPTRLTSDMRPLGDTSRKWVQVSAAGRAHAVGRRKKSIARVWAWEVHAKEMAQVKINNMSLSQFFGGHWEQRFMVLAPFFETGTAGKYAVKATAKGGGVTGQAEAVRLGIATALQGLDASLRPKLKAAGFVKRDPRQRERCACAARGMACAAVCSLRRLRLSVHTGRNLDRRARARSSLGSSAEAALLTATRELAPGCGEPHCDDDEPCRARPPAPPLVTVRANLASR
jgi:small subunit ribosomal protein S9